MVVVRERGGISSKCFKLEKLICAVALDFGYWIPTTAENEAVRLSPLECRGLLFVFFN